MEPDLNPFAWAVASAPTGIWHTIDTGDLASGMMSSELIFMPGGFGSKTDFSGMSDAQPIPFLWRFIGPGKLEFFEPNPDYPEPIQDNDWHTCAYRAEQRGRAKTWVLTNDKPIDSDQDHWQRGGGFWTAFWPIALIERFETADDGIAG